MRNKEKQWKFMPKIPGFTGRWYLKWVLITMVASAVGHGLVTNATLVRGITALTVPHYMEEKYHKEYILVGYNNWPYRGIAYVSPKDEPKKVTEVHIYGETPWNIQLGDQTLKNVATEYMKKMLQDLVKSQYAENIYWQGNSNESAAPEGVQILDSLYTPVDVAKGPETAPEAYRGADIFIHFYGKPEDREAMIKEMYGILRKIAEKGFRFESMSVVLIVGDSEILRRDNWLSGQYEEMNFEDINGPVQAKYLEKGQIWALYNCLDHLPEDVDRAVKDFDYFRTVNERVRADN